MSAPLPTRLPTAEEKIQEVMRLKREAEKVRTLYHVYAEKYESAKKAYNRAHEEMLALIEADRFTPSTEKSP